MDFNELECKKVLEFFEEISKIPRASGKEKQISDYLVKFAKDRGLWCNQDRALNVVIKKDATKGFENSPTIVIQGHMDMVCVKRNGVEHNFDTDPIKLIYEGDFLKADGTTLGGDDGIAVAMALAILDSDTIEHPAIEVLITTDEEVGMDGAEAFDGSVLDGRIMLNIDSEDEGVFTTGCAGGLKPTSKLKMNIQNIDDDRNFFEIYVGGLLGGHSGIDIDKERANAIRVLARVLNEIKDKTKVCYVNGGAKDNAIPCEAQAIIGIESKYTDDVKHRIDVITEKIKNEYRKADKNLFVELKEKEKQDKCFTDESLEKLISLIFLIPTGVQSVSKEVDGLTESSNNIGVLRTNDDVISITCAVRSAVASKKYFILEQIKLASKMVGAEVSSRGDYPAWEYRENSMLRDTMCKVYEAMFAKKPVIDIIHAGLECGIFGKKIKDMDMISFGPDLFDIHTPDERLSISSLERTWTFLLEVLKSF